MEDRIGIQVDQLNLVKIEKALEKGTGRESKSTIKERFKNNNSVGVNGGK